MSPWKDKAKNNQASAIYGKKNYKRLTLCIRIDSGIPEALDLMQRVTGMPQPVYAKEALMEQLKKMGISMRDLQKGMKKKLLN